MTTPDSLLTPRNYKDFYENSANRVREPEMDTETIYSFIAELALSQYGGVGEFQARIARVELHEEMGRASLILCLIDTDINDSLVFLDSTSTEGFIIPNRRQPIAHNRIQGIGAVTSGYLLGPSDSMAPTSTSKPEVLTAHASYSDPHGTRTSALTLSGIELSAD